MEAYNIITNCPKCGKVLYKAEIKNCEIKFCEDGCFYISNPEHKLPKLPFSFDFSIAKPVIKEGIRK